MFRRGAFPIVLLALLASSVALAANVRFSPGYVVQPEDVPMSDVKQAEKPCGKAAPCSKEKQDQLLKESSRALDCLGCGPKSPTGMEDGTGVEMDPPLPERVRTPKKKVAPKPGLAAALADLEKDVDAEDKDDKATGATGNGFAPCPELEGCSACLANPECGFCRTSKKCMFASPDGPDAEKQPNATCPGGRDAWNAAECEAPSCAMNNDCNSCIENRVCGWCPGQGCTEGHSLGPASGSCTVGWLSGVNGTCPAKARKAVVDNAYSGPEGSDKEANLTALEQGAEAPKAAEKVVAGDEVGEPGKIEMSDEVQHAIEKTTGRLRGAKAWKDYTPEDDAKNVTAFHAKLQRERAEAAALKFRAVSQQAINVKDGAKWETISTSSFLETGESKGQGVLEAAACVCNGKCEKPMEDATNCPCDCAAPKKKKIVLPGYSIQAEFGKNLPEWSPESHFNAGVVAKLASKSAATDLNETKIALDTARCAAALTDAKSQAGCSSCADLVGCGFCGGANACLAGDNTGPFTQNCSKGWHSSPFTCDDFEHKHLVVTPTTVMSDMAATGATTEEAAAAPETVPAKTVPAKTVPAKAAGADDDIVDDEPTRAPPAKAAAAGAPMSKALLEAEMRTVLLTEKVDAMLKACKAGKCPEMAGASVKGYLKLASEIAKMLKNQKQGKKDAHHDAFVAKLNSKIQSTMANIDGIMTLLAKAKSGKTPATAAATTTTTTEQKPLTSVVKLDDMGLNDDEDEETASPAATAASGATGTSATGATDEAVGATGATGGVDDEGDENAMEEKAKQAMASISGATGISADATGGANGELSKQLSAMNKTLAANSEMIAKLNSTNRNFTLTIDMLHGKKKPDMNVSTEGYLKSDKVENETVAASSGATGASSESGSSGASGASDSESGSSGASGASGSESGSSGASGASGSESGSSGASGASGSESGSSGASGSESGSSGASGASGSESGSSGASGASESGSSGASGASSASGPMPAASGPSSSGSSGAAAPAASGPTSASSSGAAASGPSSSGSSGAAATGAATGPKEDPMVKQDKLDAESDNQIEELKVAAQVRARELDRELKMKKANATLEAEEKDRVAKRKVEEANIAAAKGDEDAKKDEDEAGKKDADKKKKDAEKKAKAAAKASKDAEDKSEAEAAKAQGDDAKEEKTAEKAAESGAKKDAALEKKAKKEEDALKAKEDKAVAAAEKEKVNLEKAAAKEEAKDAKAEGKDEMNLVKQVEKDHKKSEKEQQKLDKDAAASRKAMSKAEADAEKTMEKGELARMAAHEKVLAKSKADNLKAHDMEVKMAEKDLVKYMADLMAAETRLNADHTKEWKAAETLAGKRHAMAKKMINNRFLSLKARYIQVDKDAKLESAETLKNGKDHAADLVLETMQSINDYKKQQLAFGKEEIKNTKTQIATETTEHAAALKTAQAEAKLAVAAEKSRFDAAKATKTTELQGDIDRTKAELKTAEKDFAMLKKTVTEGEAEGEKLLAAAKKKWTTSKAAEQKALEKATKEREGVSKEIDEMHEKASQAQKKISDSNRAAWTGESEAAKETTRAEQLKDQIEGLKRDIENRKKAIAEAKAIEAERLKHKEPEGDFICPDGTKVFDLSNCPEGGGPVEKARAIAAQKERERLEKKKKDDEDKKQADAIKEMEDALKELEKGLTDSGVAKKAAEAAAKKGKADSEAAAKEIEGFGKKAQELAKKAEAAEVAERQAQLRLHQADADWDSQRANHDAVKEGLKNRMASISTDEGVKIPQIKTVIATAEGTMKTVMTGLTNENTANLAAIQGKVDGLKADHKKHVADLNAHIKEVTAAQTDLDKEVSEKCKRMETRAKSLEKFHLAAAKTQAESIKTRAKEIMAAGILQATNAKDTQLKAAEAQFLSAKGSLQQEKATMDAKISKIKERNQVAVKKEKALRKLENVRLDSAKMKMQSLETRVKATTKKLQDKLKHASSLQQKAMKMENKEKVQPDVIHQIISDIRKETMEAVSLNSALKELKEFEQKATTAYANLEDETFKLRSRRAERARGLIAELENDKARVFSDIHQETKTNAEALWDEADNGIAAIRKVVDANQASRKRGEHLTGPLNEMKNQVVALLGSRRDSLNAALEGANMATQNYADRAAVQAAQQVGVENFLINPQPNYPIKPVVQSSELEAPTGGANPLDVQQAGLPATLPPMMRL